MKHVSTYVSIAAAVAAAITVGAVVAPFVAGMRPASAQSDAFSRIVSSKTIRCGYVIAPPNTIRDPNSGKLSGMSYDTLEAAAKQAGYKLNWAEEVTWATMIEGLRAGRYDMICSGIWVSSTRAQFADFTAPIFYNAVNVYVRTGDSRFDNNLPLAAKYAAINQKDVKIATIDGEITAIVADQRFPQASRFALPQNTDLPQLLLSVVDRKADVTFMDPYTAAQFLKSHPGTLRDISSEQPIQVYPLSYIVPKGNYALRDLMNAMLSEVINNGTVDGIITKYDIAPGTVYPLAYPYRTPIQPPGR